MPYIITTTRPGSASWDESTTRWAVATLDEAQEAAAVVITTGRDMDPRARDGGWDFSRVWGMPEQGDTVGPLPDGTVIEVEWVDWYHLHDAVAAAGDTKVYAPGQGLINAYNATQEHHA
jgi:hypothetical protein